MSTKYSGGLITKNPVTPAGPYETGAAPGVWTVEQALQYTKQGIWPTQGNVPTYIEDVFSTYLYTGTGSAQTITNGMDLSTKGGLVWIKNRGADVLHQWWTTLLGNTSYLRSNGNEALFNSGSAVITYNANGFSLNTSSSANNANANTYVGWTFRKQTKFFDVVTYTGNGANRTIAHNLGSVPGCIIVKRTDTTADWAVYHRSLANTEYLVLNSTAAKATGATWWNSTTPTSTVFSLGTDASVNASGGTYVAYLFAHDAGGFGLTGTDNVISCGSYTATGNDNINLGFEAQWVLHRRANTDSEWYIQDIQRGMSLTSSQQLQPNASDAEGTFTGDITSPTATGFHNGLWGSGTIIYIAIRRGPMKVPTSGTSVFNALSRTGTAATATVSTTILPDLVMSQARGGMYNVFYDRLRGAGATLSPNLGTDAESVVTNGITAFNNTSYTVGSDASQNRINWNTYTYANWLFQRAPSFFDEVCYTGTGSARTVTHNLTVAPELMIFKQRDIGGYWMVYPVPLGNKYLVLQRTDAVANGFTGLWNNTAPTSSVFSLGTGSDCNQSGGTYVAYLFATCAGVSKVGSYTGTGATQTINCGFGAGGSRFVLIKRTDSTGDWYVWDSARGMVSGTDPSLLLNSTAAEVNANSIYTISTGFQIVSTAAGINASGGTYIFLAIA